MAEKYFPLFLLMLVPLLQGCPEKSKPVTETIEINEWVYKQVDANYLWADELPDWNESRPGTPTQEYFDTNLRYRDKTWLPLAQDYYGDRFSSIKFVGKENTSTRATEVTEQDFDFGFLLSRILYSDESLNHLQVLYVIPGGPADLAGLRRGDTFNTINGTKVTNSNYSSILSGATTIRLHRLNRDTEEEITIRKDWYYNYPILLDTIYDAPAATAYLIYNHFTDGDSKAGYVQKLMATFGRFKAAGVETLILDLRYNGGGEIANAILLASLIAPENMLGKDFMYVEDKNGKLTPYKLMSNVRGYNADIKNLYIITSQNTASASELIIHTLRPIFEEAGRELYVVGQTTRGKNVGGHTISDKQYEWEINLITLRVYDINKYSGYEKGLDPDTGRQDREYIGNGPFLLPPLGDFEHEYLLNIAVRQFFNVPAVINTRQYSRSAGEGELAPVPMVPERGLTFGK